VKTLQKRGKRKEKKEEKKEKPKKEAGVWAEEARRRPATGSACTSRFGKAEVGGGAGQRRRP